MFGALGFFDSTPLEYYSNAGAIVFHHDRQRALFGHLNGLPRELGIPVICIDSDKYKNLNFDTQKLTVYVNEFSEEGFIARA